MNIKDAEKRTKVRTRRERAKPEGYILTFITEVRGTYQSCCLLSSVSGYVQGHKVSSIPFADQMSLTCRAYLIIEVTDSFSSGFTLEIG